MPHRPQNQGKIYPKVRNGGDHSQEKGDIRRKHWGQKFLPWWRKPGKSHEPEAAVAPHRRRREHRGQSRAVHTLANPTCTHDP